MSFQYLTNVSLDRAREDYLAALKKAGFCSRVEEIPVGEACQRITAQAVYAHICAPHYQACAMDGVALEAAVTFGATETTPVVLSAEQYRFVDTGDPVPEGCNAVVMIEDVVTLPSGQIRLHAPAVPWQNIRQIGEDICAGEMIVSAFSPITPAAIGAMIAGGVSRVKVIQSPVVGIIPTGDEIVPPTEDPKPGDILEFNSSIFSGMLAGWGAKPKVYPIVKDQFHQIRDQVAAAAEACDIVLVNAGSSAGREDYSASVIQSLGEVFFHGIAIKPGKPAILGRIGCKPVLGIPGYPVSGIIVIEELLKPILDLWFHTDTARKQYATAVLTRGVVSGLKYQEFVRVRAGMVGDRLVAAPLSRGSGVVSSFMKADGILEIPQGQEGFEAGESVNIRLLRPMDRLQHTLMTIGSHDPILDEMSDLLHRADPRLFMSSSHVGSMGGIFAVRRGEAHLAGVHLLDETDGSYNRSFIRKYFPNGGVRLVECVGREQGLMLAPGNPLGIAGIEDVARCNARYVNRQKGSGTRILTDYLRKEKGIPTDKIRDYEREEFTHTAVAAQIASGSADAGMGIYSAAKLYGLDFVPVCMEQYDLLIPDYAWDTPMLQKLLEILGSPAFQKKVEAMGGYRLEHPGKVRERF